MSLDTNDEVAQAPAVEESSIAVCACVPLIASFFLFSVFVLASRRWLLVRFIFFGIAVDAFCLWPASSLRDVDAVQGEWKGPLGVDTAKH